MDEGCSAPLLLVVIELQVLWFAEAETDASRKAPIRAAVADARDDLARTCATRRAVGCQRRTMDELHSRCWVRPSFQKRLDDVE